MRFWPINRISLRPGLQRLTLNVALIIQCLSWNNFLFNFTYPVRCFRLPLGVRVPQVEYHCFKRYVFESSKTRLDRRYAKYEETSLTTLFIVTSDVCVGQIRRVPKDGPWCLNMCPHGLKKTETPSRWPVWGSGFERTVSWMFQPLNCNSQSSKP
jgi:hypothetical protein